jgi:hypothetical protein
MTPDPELQIVALVVAAALGAAVGTLLLRKRLQAELREQRARADLTHAELEASRSEAARAIERAERVPVLEARLATREEENTQLQVESARLKAQTEAAHAHGSPSSSRTMPIGWRFLSAAKANGLHCSSRARPNA